MASISSLALVDHRQQIAGRRLVELDAQRLLAVEEVPLLLFGVVHDHLGDVAQPQASAKGQGADLVEVCELAFDPEEKAPRAFANSAGRYRLVIRANHRRHIADVDAQRRHAVGNQVDLDHAGFVAANLDIGHPLEALQAADDYIFRKAIEAFTWPIGTDVETQDRPVGALKSPDLDALEIGREPVTNPIHPVADIDRGQVHVGAVDKADADIAR